jgi:hypothetical protein
MLDEVPRLHDTLVWQGTVGAVLPFDPIGVGEDFIGTGAFKEDQGAIAEEAIELFRLHPLVAGEELTLGVGVSLEVDGLNGVLRLHVASPVGSC